MFSVACELGESLLVGRVFTRWASLYSLGESLLSGRVFTLWASLYSLGDLIVLFSFGGVGR